MVVSPVPLEPAASALPPPNPEPATALKYIEPAEKLKTVEVAVRVEKRSQHPKKSASPSPQTSVVKPEGLNLIQANILVAMLGGGFQARRSDGHPGARVMQRGLLALASIMMDRRLRLEIPRSPPPPLKRARKPG